MMLPRSPETDGVKLRKQCGEFCFGQQNIV